MEAYLDDDIDDDRLIRLAQKARHRLVSPRSCGRRGSHDAVHFHEAVSRGLPLLSRNYRDFPHLHELVLACGGHHSGLLLIRQDNDPTRDMTHEQIVRALTRLEQTVPNLQDQLVILNQWR